MSDPTWWQVIAPSAVIASMPGIWKAFEWWRTRADSAAEKAITQSMTVGERETARLASERDALSKDQREFVERVEAERDRAWAEAERERSRRMALERDRDRGWNLARHYWRLARDIMHALANARQIAGSLAARSKEEPPEWVPYDVPLDLEAPYPRDPV